MSQELDLDYRSRSGWLQYEMTIGYLRVGAFICGSFNEWKLEGLNCSSNHSSTLTSKQMKSVWYAARETDGKPREGILRDAKK